jgi:hypothetical protein
MRFFLFFLFFFFARARPAAFPLRPSVLAPDTDPVPLLQHVTAYSPSQEPKMQVDAVARWRDPLHSSRKRAGGAGLALFSSPNFLHQFLTLIRIIKYELMIKSIS